jgi:hypothetical protein
VSHLDIDPLTRADLPDALRLSTEAGWNQTAADWGRLLDLCPGGCFAGRVGGALVATATAASYPPAATWIGMVIVALAFRKRGFGTRMLGTALDHGLRSGSAAVGLDATDLGRPVYLRQGFADVGPIQRWLGPLIPRSGAAAPAGLEVEPLGPGPLPQEALAFDRQASGLDRSALLAHLHAEPGVVVWIARQAGRIAGLAVLRPGREHHHLGPLVAEHGGATSALLDAAGRQLGGRSVLVDAPGAEQLAAPLAARGLSVKRRLVRMTYGQPRGILSGAQIAAATAFEWG